MLCCFRKMTEDMKVEHRSMGKMRSVWYIRNICCPFSLSIAFTFIIIFSSSLVIIKWLCHQRLKVV